MDQTLHNPNYPKGCYWVGAALVVYVVLAVTILVCVHLNVSTILANAKILRAHVMCGAFGMLGAAVAATRKYYRTLITESTARATGKQVLSSVWDFGWVYYYLTRPSLGAVLGALSYTLSFLGFQVLAAPADLEISTEGRFLLYALAFVSGFSVSQVLDRLDAVARQLFQSRVDETGRE